MFCFVCLVKPALAACLPPSVNCLSTLEEVFNDQTGPLFQTFREMISFTFIDHHSSHVPLQRWALQRDPLPHPRPLQLVCSSELWPETRNDWPVLCFPRKVDFRGYSGKFSGKTRF